MLVFVFSANTERHTQSWVPCLCGKYTPKADPTKISPHFFLTWQLLQTGTHIPRQEGDLLEGLVMWESLGVLAKWECNKIFLMTVKF